MLTYPRVGVVSLRTKLPVRSEKIAPLVGSVTIWTVDNSIVEYVSADAYGESAVEAVALASKWTEV